MDELFGRQMPHSAEAEQAVLGALLIDSRYAAQVISQLRPEEFYIELNRGIYEVICSMFNFARPIDAVTVLDEMKRQGGLAFGKAVRRPLLHFAVPMLVGGLLCVAMLMQGHYGLTSTFMLVFYGLALLNASHYTSPAIALLGYCELVLGVLDCFVASHAILFWFLGFGLLHLLFGAYFAIKKKDSTL